MPRSRASEAEHPVSPVGRLLRRWRRLRGLSQLGLALEAQISARHLSFVETGRSRVSRDTVLRLAEALGVPLRQRNALLTAAGYAPLYRGTSLFAPEMTQVRRAVEFLLARHEPYSALALDRCWNVVLSNAPHRRFLAQLVDPPAVEAFGSNLLRLTFHPEGLRPCIVNWDIVGSTIIRRVHREADEQTDDELAALLDEVLSYPGVTPAWRQPNLDDPPPLLLPVHLRRGSIELVLFSTITTLGTPQDVTLEGLRIETFFPANAQTERVMRAATEADRPPGSAPDV